MSQHTASRSVILVVGATGATGRHVVAQLLAGSSNDVKVIVRSADKMRRLLLQAGVPSDVIASSSSRLQIMETASWLDLPDDRLDAYAADVDAVVCCLGHTLDWQGMYGHPRYLVTDATKRLTAALARHHRGDDDDASSAKKKFVLMGSDGVAWPGHDDLRPFFERVILALIRYMVPPHVDNESAAAYLLSTPPELRSKVEWTIVRPTDLVNHDDSNGKKNKASTTTSSSSPTPTPPPSYQLYDKPQGSLFGSGTATRWNVAEAMVKLVRDDESLWNRWKFQMPVLVDDVKKYENEGKKTN